MNNTLRNNKNLLRGRKKGFFKRELSYSELREYYHESQKDIQGKAIDEKSLMAIRARIRNEQSKYQLLKFLTFCTISLILGLASYSLLFHRPARQYDPITIKLFENKEADRKFQIRMSVHEMQQIGLENMAKRNYFLAMGNFQNALKKKPNDKTLELLYAEAISLLCVEKGMACKKANEVIAEFLKKHPNDFELKQYETNLANSLNAEIEDQ